MNKKFMSTLVIGIFAMTIVSAGLVNYLSNTSEVSMKVSSPIEVSEIVGDDLSGVYGGESRTVSATLTNLADAQIKGTLEIVVSEADISLDDFSSLTADMTEYIDEVEVYSIADLDMKTTGQFVESIDTKTDGEITFTTTERTFEIGEHWDASFTLGFNTAVVGDYEVAVRMIPTPVTI